MEGILISIGIVGVATIVIVTVFYFTLGQPTKTRRCHFSTDDPEVVIIGAGVTGASLAAALGKNGRRVVVIERDMSPPINTFRGENLQPGGLKALQDMGLDAAVKDIKGMPFDGLLLDHYETGLKTKITYSTPGITTYYHCLVQPLRKHAKMEQTVHFIEGVATELVKENGRVVGVKYRENDSQDTKLIRTPLTVISDGPYSKFRKVNPKLKGSAIESYVFGIELRNVQCPDPAVTMVGYGYPFQQPLLYRLDETTTRLLLTFRDKPPENIGTFLETEVIPTLPDYLHNPVQEALKRQTYYKCVQATRTPPSYDSIPGVLVLGDALNNRDPMGATGMTVAFCDVKFWQRALRDIPDLGDDGAFLKKKELFKKERKSYSWTMNMIAHTIITLCAEHQRSSVKLRHVLLRNTKALEKDVPHEVQAAAYDLFALLNVDEALLRMTLYNTCRDAVLECMTWHNLKQPWQTAQDVYGIINKYWNIISTDV